MAVVTAANLVNNTRKFLNSMVTPSFANAPLCDLALRLGSLERNGGAEFQERFVKAREALQTVDTRGTWTAATNNMIAYNGIIWTSPAVPAEFDLREVLGSSIETVSHFFETQVKLAIDNMAYAMSYAMFSESAYDGSTYDKPWASILNSLPLAATGTYYGINRATYTGWQHYYAGQAAYGGGAAANMTDFVDPETGFITNLRKAKAQALQRGAGKFVLFCDSTTFAFFGRKFDDYGGNAPTAKTLSWVPTGKVYTKEALSIGEIGYDTSVFEGIMIVCAPGVSANTGYLIPFACNNQPNVKWRYNSDQSVKRTQKFPFYFADWNMLDRSQIWSSAVFNPSAITIGDLSVCARLEHSGTYDANL